MNRLPIEIENKIPIKDILSIELFSNKLSKSKLSSNPYLDLNLIRKKKNNWNWWIYLCSGVAFSIGTVPYQQEAIVDTRNQRESLASCAIHEAVD